MKMKKTLLITLVILGCCLNSRSQSLLIEAESFADKGGWVVDQQFVEQMGSPYLLAHGMGKPVKDALTNIAVKKAGKYYVWVRTKNWAPGNWEAPGKFNVTIDSKCLERILGNNPEWNWEYAGSINLTTGEKKLSLHDITGFEGRCDAIYFTLSESEKLPNDKESLKKWRSLQLGIAEIPGKIMKYDLVVVGGGLAGCAASISAA